MRKEKKKVGCYESLRKGYVLTWIILRVEVLCVGRNNRKVRTFGDLYKKSLLYLTAQTVIRRNYKSP